MELFGLGKPSKTRFASMMTRVLAEAGVPEPITYDEGRFCLSFRGDSRMDLHHAYGDYCSATRQQRKQVLTGYVQGAVESLTAIPDDLSEARPNIVSRVRESVYYPLIALLARWRAVRCRVRLRSGFRRT